MNKTRYSATEFARNKPMNFRPSGTLKKSTPIENTGIVINLKNDQSICFAV